MVLQRRIRMGQTHPDVDSPINWPDRASLGSTPGPKQYMNSDASVCVVEVGGLDVLCVWSGLNAPTSSEVREGAWDSRIASTRRYAMRPEDSATFRAIL